MEGVVLFITASNLNTIPQIPPKCLDAMEDASFVASTFRWLVTSTDLVNVLDYPSTDNDYTARSYFLVLYPMMNQTVTRPW